MKRAKKAKHKHIWALLGYIARKSAEYEWVGNRMTIRGVEYESLEQGVFKRRDRAANKSSL